MKGSLNNLLVLLFIRIILLVFSSEYCAEVTLHGSNVMCLKVHKN